MKTRTRVAPSPTGSPHIGTAYIALFNYAFAKSRGGEFVLRIEDTDRVRSSAESEQAIFDALRWTGLAWDEGPDAGGTHGPYRQSERTDIYREHCQQLVEAGHAYPCFCSAERLAALRREQEQGGQALGYDGLCRGLAPAEAAQRIAAGEPHVVRLRVPEEGDCVFADRLRGEISIPWANVDDQVLLKTDGFPTYHLAVVVDDHLMEISHIIRGEEWISSTPKHVFLFEAFGWEMPELIHLPLLRNPDKSKLSKRKNPTSILYYREAGYLPEALLNFLGLMAYSPADGEEVFSLEKMVASFDIDRVSLGGPIFDLAKLDNFNGRYLRSLSPEELMDRLASWRLNSDTWTAVAALAQPRLEKLSDLVPMSAYLFGDRLTYDPALLTEGLEDPSAVVRRLRIAQWEIEKTQTWDESTVHSVFARIGEKEDIKLKKLMMPFYVTFGGSKVGLPVFDSMVLLGRDLCLRRIQYAIEALAGIDVALSGKALKKLAKDYAARYA